MARILASSVSYVIYGEELLALERNVIMGAKIKRYKWKITRNQYEKVKEKEGCWYCKEILLGEDDGVPIYTITNEDDLSNILCPSKRYIKTIAIGIKETYNFNEEEITKYLITKD